MTAPSLSVAKHEDVHYIRKTGINLAAISDPESARGAGGKPPPKPYPAKEKLSVLVSLETPTLTLDGTMYHLPRQTIGDVLDEKTLFLPLTDVTIVRENHIYGKRPFVAVRKEQILSLKEEI